MKSLTLQIAELIYGESQPEGKRHPQIWRLQIPHWDNIILFSANDGADYAETWQMDLKLPDGYSYGDYEDALDQIFPHIVREKDENNRSFRIISRKTMEDSLHKILAKVDSAPEEPKSVGLKSIEGIGWLKTEYFQINPIEDDVDSGRSYFHAKSRDGSRYAIVRDELGRALSDKGLTDFEFHDSYILTDPETKESEQIEIYKTVGAYGVRYSYSAPLPWIQ